MLRLARQGVFCTIQGEGLQLGQAQVFVRLAGCNVQCPECDTDYRLHRRVSVDEVARQIVSAAPAGVSWVWVTGGEPMLQRGPLRELFATLRPLGYRFALATSGTIDLGGVGSVAGGPDFVSVSPHRIDATWLVRRGDQLNAVVGLNGLTLAELDTIPATDLEGFSARYVTPCHGSAIAAADLMEWVRQRPAWRLGIQAHRYWRVP